MEKKSWEKPEVLVLTRSKPEEGVLSSCKGAQSPGPNATQATCIYNGAFCGDCLSNSLS